MDIRQAALKCLIKILEHNKSYEETFNLYVKKVDNPSELKNTVSGAVKQKIILDYFINCISSKKAKQLSPISRNLLRLGVFELEFLKRPEYAVVNSYVELCKKQDKNAVKFVNAVLRNFIRKRSDIFPRESDIGEIKFLSIKYSHPEWMVERWIKTYGREKTEKICEHNNSPSKISLRINTIKIDKEDLLNLFKKHGIEFKQSLFSENCLIINHAGNIKKIPGYEEGFWVVQGESSSLVSEILDPQPGERILDFCAAPGVKTTHIASLMKDHGRVVAVDISTERIKRITENCERLGVNSVEAVTGDATEFSFNEKFDRILVDAPCSNTGVLSARPDARWKKKPKDIENLAGLQQKILKNAAQQLKPGGILVYSTCSIEPEENVVLIRKFLEENKNFIPVNFQTSSEFIESEFPGSIQILQSESGIDGFYIAKLMKAK